MSPDFENRLREHLADAPANELLPGFSKDALWPQVAARAKVRRPLRVVLPWLSHAAAVAAGLLLAWAVLPTGNVSKPAIQSASIVRTRALGALAQTAEVNALGGDSLLVDTKDVVPVGASALPSSTAGKQAKAARRGTAQPRSKTAEDIALPTVFAPVHPAADSLPTAQPAVAEPVAISQKEKESTRQPAPVVVHLLDMTGEDRIKMRAQKPVPAQRGVFARLLSRNKVPDITGANAADAVVMRLLLSR